MELTRETKIKLSQIVDLKDWVQDKHSNAKIGDIRRWADGNLHEKTAHGWKVIEGNKDFKLKTDKKKSHQREAGRSITLTQEYKHFVDCLMDYKLFEKEIDNLPNTFRFPDLNKPLAKQLGTDSRIQFVIKDRYGHISYFRKSKEGQALRKDEYYKVPEVIKNAKEAYIDGHEKKHNFFITFPDDQDPEKINKIIFEKTPKGNYIKNLSKVNKKGFIEKEKTLLASGEGLTHIPEV